MTGTAPAGRRGVRAGWRAGAVLLAVLAALPGARGQTPSPAPPADAVATPYLRVETGDHQAIINRIALLADGSALVSVSNDKTARLWKPDTLAPIDVLLPPVGPGDDGALYAVATSPRLIAVAGRIPDAKGQFGIALFSAGERAPLGVIGLPAAATALRFSRDGTALAAGMQNGAGVWVLDLKARRLSLHDTEYAGDVTWLDFDAKGRLAAAAEDGKLRLYDGGQRRSVVALPRGAKPWGVAFAPDGGQIAVGDRNHPVVHLFDAAPLRFRRDLTGDPQHGGSLNVVAYAPDGATLLASGRYVDKTGKVYLRRWPLAGTGAAHDTPISDETVTDLLTVPDGLVFATAEPSLGRMNLMGALGPVRHAHLLAGHAAPDALLLSADGTVISLPGAPAMAGMAGARTAFDAQAHEIVAPKGIALAGPVASAKGLSVTNWQNSHTPRLNGKPLQLEPAETSRSVAVAADGTVAVLGTDYFVRLVGRVGGIWSTPVEAPAWAVNISADGHLVVASLADGTVHWYDSATGHDIQALFLEPSTQRWVLWTPQEGFFDHDHRTDGQPDGRTLIGYRFNLPDHRSSAFVQIGQLYSMFFRPDLVGLSLRDDDAGRAVVAEEYARLGRVGEVIAAGLPPQVRLLGVCDDYPGTAADACAAAKDGSATPAPAVVPARTGAAKIRIRYRLTDPSGRVGGVRIQRNDAVITTPTAIDATEPGSRTETATLTLAMGLNLIRLSPISSTRAVEAADADSVTFTILREPPPPIVAPVPAPAADAAAVAMRSTGDAAGTGTHPPAAPLAPPRLYVLSVGVSRFMQPGMSAFNLANAARDARAVAALLREPTPPVYGAAVMHLLDDDDEKPDSLATAANILAALRDIADSAQPDDLVVLFFAGHGREVGGKYYFAPVDLGVGRPDLVAQALQEREPEMAQKARDALFSTQGVAQGQILPLIQSIQASHVAVLLDTCYSADVAIEDAVLQRNLNSTVSNTLGHAVGRFVFSSSFSQAYDSAASAPAAAADDMARHGMFTAFLLKALQGAADFDGSNLIDVYKLAVYTKKNVIEASTAMARQNPARGGVQQPSFYFAGNDFFALRSTAPQLAAETAAAQAGTPLAAPLR